MPSSVVRVSIGTIAVEMRVLDGSTPIDTRYFGILNPKEHNKSNKSLFQALGGGVHLTPEGVKELESRFGAHSFEADGDSVDARFRVGEERLDEVFAFFKEAENNGKYFDMDPLAEIFGELTKRAYECVPAVLLPSEARTLSASYIDVVEQPLPIDGKGTSVRLLEGVPTRRLFFRFTLLVPQNLFVAFQTSHAIHFLTEKELASTDGGRRQGITSGGDAIADNIFERKK